MNSPKSPAKRTELQRLLSKRGVASRSKAAQIIRLGQVTVNGKIITDPRAYVSEQSTITVSDELVKKISEKDKIVIAFHKPRGCVTTTSDEKSRKTVYDFLPEKYRSLKAIGRLDMATSGLLLFTNDNALADRLLDPKNQIPRTYIVQVEGLCLEQTAATCKKGNMVDGELLFAKNIEILKSSNKESTLSITLTEGKNREIRRLCKALGHEVTKLKRISFGPIHLSDLPVGETKIVTLNY